MLDEDDRTLQSTAIRTLGKIGEESALPRLEAIAADPKHRFQDEATQAVASIRTRTQSEVR